MKSIGLVLSGGGVRAVLFHFGVLKWIADQNFWDEISHISSVSGGSWCLGCVIAHAGGDWPDREAFTELVLSAMRQTWVEGSFRKELLRTAIRHPAAAVLRRSEILAETFTRWWGLTIKLSDLPSKPILHINAATFETGKRWVFSNNYMGDHVIGYVDNPNVSLSRAVAASSAFPGIAGPLQVDVGSFEWRNGPYISSVDADRRGKIGKLHLWDGGVYENTGLEPLFKRGALQHELEFLIVADAADPFAIASRSWLAPHLLRLLAISMDQVRSLRARQVVSMFEREGNGIYAKIGKSAKQHFDALGGTTAKLDDELSEEEVLSAATWPIWPGRVPPEVFDRMVRHGWQTCEAIYSGRVVRGSL